MLKVFSNQLRRIHKQVETLLVGDEQINPETGLYKIGEYYMKNKRYAQALHAYKRYLVYYPSGAFAADVTTKIVSAEEFLSRYGSGEPPASAAAPAAPPEAKADASDLAQQYYNAVSLVSQEKYMEAFKAFKKIIDGGADAEYSTKAEFEMAKCLFYLKQFDSCIKSFTAIVQKFPKHPEMKDAIFFVARSYEEKGDKAKAAGLFKKILTMGTDEDPVIRKVKKALRALEGGGS
jgi:TolA-binding protein